MSATVIVQNFADSQVEHLAPYYELKNMFWSYNVAKPWVMASYFFAILLL